MKYYIVVLDTGDKYGPYDDAWSAEGKAKTSGMRTAVIDSDNNVICGYSRYGVRIEPEGQKKLQEVL